MVKRIKKIILSKFFAKILLKSILRLHSLLTKLISVYATKLNNEVHPKHLILKYKEWFVKNIEEDKIVLDIGCNTGSLAKKLSVKCNYIYGLEIVPGLVEKAYRINASKNIEYICADATKFDYTHIKPIDYVTLSNVLEHIENRIEFLNNLVHKINWNDENNKKFLIRVPSLDRDWITVYKKNLGIEYRLDRTHFIEYTFEEFTKEINKAGLKIVNHEVKFGEIYVICEVKE